jgi:hypothetical protein
MREPIHSSEKGFQAAGFRGSSSVDWHLFRPEPDIEDLALGL